ncbi:kinase-like protein [Coprinopsis marcescibilis]|uniref:Kinase-like protein n=1 Tax=Coprinopsis marcescibilis TaxID=230819 RepID=A0A5C3KME7_COPMA|nr:kinase-like protein [Coprinopsis marcescibilis]
MTITLSAAELENVSTSGQPIAVDVPSTNNRKQLLEAVLRATGIAKNENFKSSDNGGLGLARFYMALKEIVKKGSSRALLSVERQDQYQMIIDSLHSLLLDNRVGGQQRIYLCNAMIRFCGAKEQFPTALKLEKLKQDPHPYTAGRFGYVYKGESDGKPVAIKVIKIYADDINNLSKVAKAVSKEAITWSLCAHPNLLPFYGVYPLEESEYGEVCMVSPWMANGNLHQYMKLHPDLSPKTKVSLISDVARGMAYLHENSMIHGNLKGTNILIKPDGQACLAAFGCTELFNHEITAWTSIKTGSTGRSGTLRWQAPECMPYYDPPEEIADVQQVDDVLSETARWSEKVDIYAFSCVCYEIVTGQIPFGGVKDNYVQSKVIRGIRPAVPAERFGLLTELLSLMDDCWKQSPAERPSAPEVVKRVDEIKNRLYLFAHV